MKVTCPHCNEEFDYKPKGKLRFSWHGVLMTFVCGLIIVGAYGVYHGIQDQPLIASVTQIGGKIKQTYDIFEQVTTTVQGRIAKQVRIHIPTASLVTVQEQAKGLVAAERNNSPTNIFIMYFYVGSGEAPLDNWFAKVTYVNVALIKDWNWGDVAGMKNIGPGMYMETK